MVLVGGPAYGGSVAGGTVAGGSFGGGAGYGVGYTANYGAGYGAGYGGGECCAVSCDPAAACGTGAACGAGGYTTATMSYVGGGLGEYTQETTYKYVGRGAGEFGILHVPSGGRPNYCLCIVPLLLLLIPVFFLFSSSSTTTVPPPPPTLPPTPPPPAPPVPPPPVPPVVPPVTTPAPTTHCPIDCTAGYNDLGPMQWVKGWSAAKKIYCCKTAQRGCPSQLPPPSGIPPSGEPPKPDTFHYDCNAGYHNCYHCLVLQWSPAKLKFCCDTQQRGCKWNTKA
jgi:hypothetical protein